jgi:tetratricopeptide (TPR) repeat protein
MPEKRTPIIHPYILAIYPILFFYNLNKHELWFSETLIPITVSLVATLLLIIFFKIIFREISRAGILTSLILVLFYFYEAIYTEIAGSEIRDQILRLDPNLFLSYGIFLVLSVTGLYFWKKGYRETTKALNVVAVILITFPLLGLLKHQISTQGIELFSKTQSDSAIPEDFNYIGPKPDIYYIILDGYLRDDVMNQYWRFDNSEFIKSLTNRGFYVAPKSRSNYPSTGLSLASSLNMKYLPVDLEVDTTEHFNNLPFIEAIGENRVVNFLKSMGYLYVHLSDDAVDSKKSDPADIVITNRKYISFFSQYLLNKTIIKSLKFHSLDAVQSKRNNVLYGFNQLEEIPKIKEPTFTFAHFLMPHSPQAFDKDGNIPTQSDNNPDLYFGEVLYANKKIRHLVDHILENSETPPIILIQGDHGYLVAASNRPNSHQAKKSYGNLSSYYLPGKVKDQLYETITPVNSFRLIFDHYFGTQFGLLEDKSFFPISYTPTRKLIPIPDEDLLGNGPSAWVDSLKQAILERPDFAEAHAMLGTYYAELNRFPEAKASVEKALHLKPDLTWAHINLAMIHDHFKNYPKALDAILKAIRLNPKIAEAHNSLGHIQMASGKYSEAISAFKEAININPNYLVAINKIAQAYYLINDKEKSLFYFRKAVLISPSYNNYHDLGSAYAHFGFTEDAIISFKKVLEINPDLAEAYYNLGNIYTLKKNDQPKAIKHYQKALALNPMHVLAHFSLGNAYLKNDQTEEALLEFKEALRLNPDYFPSQINLGLSQLRLGQTSQARITYETALLKQPDNAGVHKNLGIIYSKNNVNPDKAIFHYQEYLRLAPNQDEATQIQSAIQALKRQGQ